MFAEVWLSNLPRWSPSVSSPPDSITVTLSCMALQRQISADSSVSRTISRELCYRLHGTLVQSHYSNNYIGFRSSRGLCSRSLSSHSTCELSNSHLISTVCWTTTYLHVTCGLKDNISSVFLSGNQLLPDAASASLRRPSGTALNHQHGTQPASEHSRHVSRPNCLTRPFSELPPPSSLASESS